jgi:hypothetical protein
MPGSMRSAYESAYLQLTLQSLSTSGASRILQTVLSHFSPRQPPLRFLVAVQPVSRTTTATMALRTASNATAVTAWSRPPSMALPQAALHRAPTTTLKRAEGSGRSLCTIPKARSSSQLRRGQAQRPQRPQRSQQRSQQQRSQQHRSQQLPSPRPQRHVSFPQIATCCLFTACSAHSACAANQYCDSLNSCFVCSVSASFSLHKDCSGCWQYQDPFDQGLCPAKCRNSSLQCQVDLPSIIIIYS